MPNVFISYAREDEKSAIEICESLVREGFSVWMDKKNLMPGQDWKTEIEKAISTSDVFVACLSNHSVSKIGFVQAELKRALDVADLMPEGKIFIIPIRLDDCQVPHKLKGLQWVNYFELKSRDNLFKAIAQRVNVQEELKKDLVEYLLRDRPESLKEKFAGVAQARMIDALISIAKREDELQSVRSRAVRGLSVYDSLVNSVWSELLPTASTELLAEWISEWGEDGNTTVLTEEHVSIMLEGRRLPKSPTGFGKVVRKFIARGAGYSSAVFLPGSTYPSWEVEYDCVRSVISLDDVDSLRVLASFSTMGYWKARERIIDYIESRVEGEKMSAEDAKIALGILHQIVTDGKTKEKTPTKRKAREMLQKLQESFKEV